MSADSGEADQDVFPCDGEINKSEMVKSSRTFQVLLKGGAPWGFTLQGGSDSLSPVQIQQVDPNGKSEGLLLEGDYILAVNGMAPESLCEGEQLVKDAFRTLTLTVWRGTSRLESSVKILRSSSFLHRSREAQERERHWSGDHDENNMAESQRSAENVTPRHRRVESFHGRSKSRNSSSNVISTTSNQDPPVTFRNHLSSSSISLSSHPSSPRDPAINKNRHSFGSTPPTSHNHSGTPGRRSLPPHSSIPTSFRNTEILPNKQRHSSGNSSTSTGSSQRASTRGTQNEESSRRPMSMKGWNTVQDLSQKQQTPARVDPSSGSHVESHDVDPHLGHLSPASSSPSLNMANPQQKKPPSPRLDMYKSSPDINSYPQPLSPRSPTNNPNIFAKGFRKMAWSHNSDFSSGYRDDKMKDVRQSLPSSNKPFKSDLHDYQNISEVSSSQAEVDATDLELQKLTQRPPREPYDPRPPCSPPAPPVRDVSSLQYVNKPQSHEKYPSWPVTQPNLETEPGESINSPKLKPVFHPQLGPVNERNSPSSERKSGDDYKRNASDPGFKKQTSLTRFMKRPTPSDHEKKAMNLESKKSAESQMEQFFSSSPGYPNPVLDQDGNRIGDEKYNIPSPPERDNRAPDEKTLSEKIASIVGPHHDSWHGSSSNYHSDFKSRDSSSFSDSLHKDYKKRDSFTRESPEKPPVVRGLVDTGTNPLGIDGKSVISSSIRSEPPRTYVVKQMVCYNTGTQTDEKSPSQISSDKYLQEKSIQARLSGSDGENFQQTDRQRRDAYSGNLGDSKDTKRNENFTDEYPHNMAPMLRKLTKEYYGGKLTGSEKRLSSASSHDSSIRSPGSDMPTFVQYPGMKEAESYSSVVIHPNENSMPFGRDYAESKSSVSDSRHDVSGLESERGSMIDLKYKQMRHGLDPSGSSPKYPVYQTGSRSDLSRDQNRLLTGHDKHSKSASRNDEFHRGVQNNDSSSQLSSTSDSRSSSSTRYSSESSQFLPSHSKPRHESTDSVFTDPSSPLTPGAVEGSRRPTDLVTGRKMGRSASMKKAYGVYEETAHKRQESEIVSPSIPSTSVHTRSHSSSEYLRMDHYQRMHAENKHMSLIREDSLENRAQDQRWEDMVRKSKMTQAEKSLNYENIHLGNKGNSYHSTKGFLPVSNLKRTSSEQIRPMKDRFSERPSGRNFTDSDNGASELSDESRNRFTPGNQSLLDLASSEQSESSFDHRPRSTSDSIPKDSSNFSPIMRHVSDSDKLSPDNSDISSSQIQNDFNKDSNLKDVQRNAVQKYMDRVTNKKLDEDSESKMDTTTTTSLTTSESFRLKYGTRAERQESLRRSRSITSRDSDYMEMRRPERQQTEWSRIRSQTTGSRPHSIGSDSSLVDPYAVTTLPSFPDSESHQRSQSDSTCSVTEPNRNEPRSVPVKDQTSENDQSSGGITKNSLYQNVGYRPPPPVPPGGDEDQPPALPPRNYRRFSASQSDSSLPHRPLPFAKERPSLGYDGNSNESRGRWDDDNYAEQLRKQSRRLSEQQHMPQPMTYKTTKTSIQFTQSYKQQHVEALEATSPNGSTSSSEHFFSSRRMSAGQQPSSPNSAPSVPPLPASKYMPSPSSPQISPKADGLSRSQHYLEPKSYHSPEPKERPRVDIPPTTQSWHNRPSPNSPDPPPPPTPQKEVNEDVDLPPPPPELIENSPDHKDDRIRYAEDSYASYKNRTDRQPGVYKRSASSGDALKLLHENNNYKQQGDIQKPPRKRLQPVWKSEQTVNQGDNIPEQTDTSYKDSPLSDRQHPRPLLTSKSASHLLAPKPYSAPESSRSSSFSVSSTDQDSVSTLSAERQSVQDRISSIERKQSLSRERPEIRQVTPQGGQYFSRKPYENFSKSFTATPSRRPFETDKFSASVSETLSGQKTSSEVHDPVISSRKNYSPEHIPSVNTSSASPPPVDRSPASGYPGVRNTRNSDSNEQSAHDSSSYNTKTSFSDSKRQSPGKPISTNSSSPSAKTTVGDLVQHSRQRSQEELECDAKVQEFAKIYEKKDPKLSSMLKSDGGRMQYMDGLFHTEIDQDFLVRRSPKTSPKSSSVGNDQEALKAVTPNKESSPDEEEKSPLPPNYWVSPSKALIEMNIRQSEGIGKDMTKDIDDSDKLLKTKEELVDSIQKKMDKLKEEKKELTKELEETETLGQEVQKAVDCKCKKQHEKDKFKTYIGDMEKIILLLLKVSGLLARAENAFQSLPEGTSDRVKKMAADKRDKAKQQHEDAKVLKEDIEKRSAQIEVFLQEALNEEEFADYKYYVKMKSKLTIEKQELEDKISLGEEQIAALKLSIPEKH